MNKLIEPISVGGIPVFPFESMNQAVDFVFDGSSQIIPGMAVAINPEKILTSIDDALVRDILINASLPFADGIGVVKVLQKKSSSKVVRIAGADLWLTIVKKAASTKNSAFLVGSKPDVIKKTVNKLIEETQITLAGFNDGYFDDEEQLIHRIKASNANVVIVALGSPRQEIFIKKCMEVHPHAFYMGVGGSFDVYVGQVKRAPAIWIKFNLEWLYRMLCEPKRIFRQYKLLKFLYLYLFNRL